MTRTHVSHKLALRQKFGQESGFLKKLKTRSLSLRRKVLNQATSKQIGLLRKLVCLIVKRHIPLSQSAYSGLRKQKVIRYLVNHFSDARPLKKDAVLKHLHKICNSLHYFINTIFAK